MPTQKKGATRAPAGKVEEGLVAAFIGALALWLGGVAETTSPGAGPVASTGIFAFGAVAASFLRDKLGFH